MKPHETPEGRAAERDEAIKVLRKGGFSARSINRILGGAPVDSYKPRTKSRSSMLASINKIAAVLCGELTVQGWIVSLADLQGERTTRAIAGPRGAAMFLARSIEGASYPAIGAYFNRDHSTVIHACSVRAWAQSEDDRLMKAVHRVLRAHGKRYQ